MYVCVCVSVKRLSLISGCDRALATVKCAFRCETFVELCERRVCVLCPFVWPKIIFHFGPRTVRMHTFRLQSVMSIRPPVAVLPMQPSFAHCYTRWHAHKHAHTNYAFWLAGARFGAKRDRNIDDLSCVCVGCARAQKVESGGVWNFPIVCIAVVYAGSLYRKLYIIRAMTRRARHDVNKMFSDQNSGLPYIIRQTSAGACSSVRVARVCV